MSFVYFHGLKSCRNLSISITFVIVHVPYVNKLNESSEEKEKSLMHKLAGSRLTHDILFSINQRKYNFVMKPGVKFDTLEV